MIRTYERQGAELTESITVHVDDNGRIRMTADNLHELLTHIGFSEIRQKANA